MFEKLMTRLLFLLMGAGVGYIAGIILKFAWFMFSGVVLGYGDRDIGYRNEITNLIPKISIVMGAILSQWYFNRKYNETES
jgi:hypothetical protein